MKLHIGYLFVALHRSSSPGADLEEGRGERAGFKTQSKPSTVTSEHGSASVQYKLEQEYIYNFCKICFCPLLYITEALIPTKIKYCKNIGLVCRFLCICSIFCGYVALLFASAVLNICSRFTNLYAFIRFMTHFDNFYIFLILIFSV